MLGSITGGTTANAAKNSSNVLLNTSRKLQAKFKHAGDFGVVGNYSKANAGKFSSAINQHINSAGVQTIKGTYRGQSVIHWQPPKIKNPLIIKGFDLTSAVRTGLQFLKSISHSGFPLFRRENLR